MKHRLIVVVFLLVLLISFASPGVASTVSKGDITFDFPEEWGAFTGMEYEDQIVFFSMIELVTLPENEVKFITVTIEDNEMLKLLPDSMIIDTLKRMFTEKGEQTDVLNFGSPSLTFLEIDISSLSESKTSFVFLGTMNGRFYSINIENLSREECRTLMSSIRISQATATAAPHASVASSSQVAMGNELLLPTIPATIRVPASMYAVTKSNNSEDLFAGMDITKEKAEAYMDLSNFDVMMFPLGKGFTDRPFSIWIRIKQNNFEDNYRDFREVDSEELEPYIKMMSQSLIMFAGGEVLESRNVTDVPFGHLKYGQKEIRYFTIMNNKMIYITLDVEDQDFSQERMDMLHAIVDSFLESQP
ncbi:MAG: hypothetical protein ACOX7B_00280 [Christensenellales bacterium]